MRVPHDAPEPQKDAAGAAYMTFAVDTCYGPSHGGLLAESGDHRLRLPGQRPDLCAARHRPLSS